MKTNRSEGKLPQVVFTSDFHTLPVGDLIPGQIVFRYDPYRIVPEAEIPGLPATQRPITVYIRYHPTNAEWQGALLFAPAEWLTVEKDVAGHGTMVEITCPLPEGNDELEVWFAYVTDAGETKLDNDDGKNYWIRFPAHDLKIIRAEVVKSPVPLPTSLLQVEAQTVPGVESVTVRWRYTYPTGHPRQSVELVKKVDEAGRILWSIPDGGVPVALNSTIAYDLVFIANGKEHTEDNNGTWYLVSDAPASALSL